MIIVMKRKLNRNTYPRLRSAAAVHDQSIWLVRTNFEGYGSGLGSFPRWQNLKQMRQMVSTTSLWGLRRKKKRCRRTEEAASSSRRMDELALSCPASAISTCNLTNAPFIIKLLKESDHSFRHERWVKSLQSI